MVDLSKLPLGPVSNRALARILGLASDNAVRAALRTGRLRRCVVPGGLDPRIAIEEWQAHTDPRQQRKVTAATDAAAAADAKRAREREGTAAVRGKGASRVKRRSSPIVTSDAPPSASRQARPPPVDDLRTRLAAHRAKRLAASAPKGSEIDGEEVGDTGESMGEIRRGMLLIDRVEKQFDWDVKRGSYIPKDPATALAMTLGRRYRDSTNQFVDRNVASMALKLGVEEHDLRMVLDDAWRAHFLKTIVSIRDDKIVNGDQDDEELEAEACKVAS